MNYLADIEYEPSEKSGSDVSDYSEGNSSVNDFEQEISEIEQNKIRYNDLIDEKYELILDFNAGKMDRMFYFTRLNQINRSLEELDYFDEQANDTLITKELEFKELLEEIEAKILSRIQNKTTQTKDYVESFWTVRLSALKTIIEALKNTFAKESEPEPLQPSFQSLQTLIESEKQQLITLGSKMGVEFPIKTDTMTEKEYLDAEREFCDQIGVFAPGFFDKYIFEESNELELLAARLGMKRPPRTASQEEKDNFYNEMLKVLPGGYTLSMKTTTIGYNYDYIDLQLLKEKVKYEIEELQSLPIQLSTQERDIIKKRAVIRPFLQKMETSELINCIFDPSNSERYSIPKQEPPTKKYNSKTIKMNELIPEDLTPAQVKEMTLRNIKRRVLVELNEYFETIRFKKVLKKIGTGVALEEHQLIIPEIITPVLRKISVKRLKIELNETMSTVIEDYIFKSSNESFTMYINKIEDILFILENYPTIKLGIIDGTISPLQLVIFEKEISTEAREYVFPISLSNRKRVIQRLISEFKKLKLFKSDILSKIIFEKRSKNLELIVYDLSGNEKEYFSNIKELIYLINENGKNMLQMSTPEVIQLLQPEEYKKFEGEFTLKELQTIMDQVQLQIIDLVKEKRKLDSIYYLGEYLIQWNPPPRIVSREDIARWNELLDSIKKTKNPDVIKLTAELASLREELLLKKINIPSENYLDWLPPKNMDPNDLEKWNILTSQIRKESRVFQLLNKLYDLRNSFSKKYNLYTSREYVSLRSKIAFLESELARLRETYIIRKIEEYTRMRSENKERIPFEPTETFEMSKNYPVPIDPAIINQVIQAFKRKLILLNPGTYREYSITQTITKESNAAVFPGFDYLPDTILPPNTDPISYEITTEGYSSISIFGQRAKIMIYTEMYDLNEYYSKLKVNGQNILPQELYAKIKSLILSKINQHTNGTYESINGVFKKQAILELLSFLGKDVPETNTETELLKFIASSFPMMYESQKVITDIYGRDLFSNVLVSRDPLDFYETFLIRNYDNLVKENTPKQNNQFKKPMILFNEKTGKYGTAAYDGLLYEVHYLDKDHRGLPINQTKVIAEKDPRTGSWIPIPKVMQKRGPFTFILRYIGTNQVGESNEVWQEVPIGSVRLYTMNYDSCSRFITAKDCKGPGLNNSTCVFKNGMCQADYSVPFSFGKKLKKKYKVR
jgi:hypothetical protein